MLISVPFLRGSMDINLILLVTFLGLRSETWGLRPEAWGLSFLHITKLHSRATNYNFSLFLSHLKSNISYHWESLIITAHYRHLELCSLKLYLKKFNLPFYQNKQILNNVQPCILLSSCTVPLIDLSTIERQNSRTYHTFDLENTNKIVWTHAEIFLFLGLFSGT